MYELGHYYIPTEMTVKRSQKLLIRDCEKIANELESVQLL
jgi:hypothetical protein